MGNIKSTPKPKKPYSFPLNISDDLRQYTERREKRAKELEIPLYVLGTDSEKAPELQELEDYIVETYIDLDLDVPEDIKQKYLELKQRISSETSK